MTNLHFLQPQVNSVVQSSGSLGACKGQPVLNLADIESELLLDFGLVSEGQEEKLIFGIGGLQERNRSVLGSSDLVRSCCR